MAHYYDRCRFISKSRLAELADVSPSTFRRYLKSRRHILEAMGVGPYDRLLPPQAVKYICEDYCIDLPNSLQDQRVINSSPLYKNLIRNLQMGTFFEGEWRKITEIPHDYKYSSD